MGRDRESGTLRKAACAATLAIVITAQREEILSQSLLTAPFSLSTFYNEREGISYVCRARVNAFFNAHNLLALQWPMWVLQFSLPKEGKKNINRFRRSRTVIDYYFKQTKTKNTERGKPRKCCIPLLSKLVGSSPIYWPKSSPFSSLRSPTSLSLFFFRFIFSFFWVLGVFPGRPLGEEGGSVAEVSHVQAFPSACSFFILLCPRSVDVFLWVGMLEHRSGH